MRTPDQYIPNIRLSVARNAKLWHTCKALAVSVLLFFSTSPVFAQSGEPVEQGKPNVPEFKPAFPEQTRVPASNSGVSPAVESFTGPLEHPWGMDILPDGSYLVTERPGRMRVISKNGKLSKPLKGIPEVLAQKQGGLLDVSLGPNFNKDRMIYWAYSKPLKNGQSATAVAKGRLSGDKSEVTDVEDIFIQEPSSSTPAHYGSRILFDGKGHVFITTGEHFTEKERVLSQELDATYGKVIRINADGSVPEDNPFVDKKEAVGSIWSYGHRNIQGAAFHPKTEQFWVIEHGPQGGDELNLVKPGANYGWPVVCYGENYDGTPVGSGKARHAGEFTEPRYYWDPVIAPAGAIFYQGDMFKEWEGDLLISSLTPGGLVRLELNGDTVTGEERLITDQGRIRDVMEAPDGSLLLLVDEPDGAVLRLTRK